MRIYVALGIAAIITLLIVVCIVRIYNKLVKGRNRVNTQWAQIDVQLMRRADLIPNLVETVKGYVSHEQEVFEKIATARNALSSAPSPGQAITANDHLSGQLVQLFAVAEAYPELKADRSFIALQGTLKETEDKIAYARQFYNDAVLKYKDAIHQFPSVIIAKLFNFKDESYYSISEDNRSNIKINY